MLNLTSILMLFMVNGGVAHAVPNAPGDRADSHQSGPTAPDRNGPRGDASGPKGGKDSAGPGNRAPTPRGSRHAAAGPRHGAHHSRPVGHTTECATDTTVRHVHPHIDPTVMPAMRIIATMVMTGDGKLDIGSGSDGYLAIGLL